MRKAIRHLRWLLAHFLDPQHTIGEDQSLAGLHFFSTDDNDTDPRSTARDGDW